MRSETRRRGLRAKMIGWFLVPTALILAVVAAFIFYTYQRLTEDLVFERNQEVTRLLADQLMVDMEEYVDRLYVLAATAGVYEEPGPVPYSPRIGFSMENLWDFDGGVLILGPDGTVRAADQRRLEIVGQDWSDRAYFQAARSEDNLFLDPAFSDIVPDGPEGSDAIAVAVPHIDNERDVDGVTVGLFRMSSGAQTRTSPFQVSIFRRLQEMGGSSAYLVDGNGRAIYHSDTWRIGEDLSTEQAVRQVLGGAVGSIRTIDLEGRAIVASFAPVPDTSWGLVVEESWDDLLGASRQYGRWMLVLLGLGVLVPAVVIALGAGRITRPIADLTTAAEEMAGGDLDQAIDVRTRDELEDLARQFNRMAAQLRASYAHLEQRVADRTRELSTLLDVSRNLTSTLDIEPLLIQILDQLRFVVDYEGATIMALEGGVIRPIAHRGPADPEDVLALRFPLDEARINEEVVQRQEPVIVPDVRGETAVAAAFRAAAGARMETAFEHVRCWMGVPLIVRGEVIGMLSLDHGEAGRYSERDAGLALAFAAQAAVAIDNARLYEEAEDAAAVAERNRLARELHDAVSQTLFSTSLIADVLPRLWERKPEEARRRLDELRELTRGAMAEMRTLLMELRPSALVETPLRDLLQQLCDATTSRARVRTTLEAKGGCILPTEVKLTLYRIAQEALNNVTKHAAASRAEVLLQCEEDSAGLHRVTLCVRDDGRGFDPTTIPPDHFGVGIMHERAAAIGATLTVASEIGKGTEVALVWLDDAELVAQDQR